MHRALLDYAVSIIKVPLDSPELGAQLVGSGTLVSAHGKRGLLTAAHVIDAIDPNKYALGISPGKGIIVLEPSALSSKVYRSSDDANEADGPDLAFCQLLSSGDLSTLAALKSFYDMTRIGKALLNDPPDESIGIWALFGCPGVYSKEEIDIAAKRRTVTIKYVMGVVGLGEVEELEPFDYALASTSKTTGSVPSTFGGLSGGGLWQCLLFEKDGETNLLGHPLLSGVAYWQSDPRAVKTMIRCHFRRSLYKVLVDDIDSN